MEEINVINQSTTVISIAISFHKVFKSIKSKNGVNTETEIDFLKKACIGDNPRVTHAACQTLLELVNSRLLEPGTVLNMLMSSLQNLQYFGYIIMIQFFKSALFQVRQLHFNFRHRFGCSAFRP